MQVNFLNFSLSPQGAVFATVRFVNGKMQVEWVGKPSQSLLEELQEARERAPSDDAFLRGLPKDFNGTYIRARLVE